MVERRNINLWYVTTILLNAAFVIPIWAIFYTTQLGFSYTEAFILNVVPFGISAFFEIPTGAWSDKYGRAKIFQLGTVLYISSVASYLFLTDFFLLLLFQFVGAIGIAMQSGGLEALVRDSIPKGKRDEIYAKVHANKTAMLFVGRVGTVPFSGYLYTINPKAPFVLAVLMFSLGLITSLFFKDVRIETPTIRSSWEHIKETALLLAHKRAISILIILLAFYSFTAEALFAFFQPYFTSLDIAVSQFGFFYLVISVISGIGALLIGRIIRRFRALRLVSVMAFALLATLLLMLLQVPALTYLAIIPSAVVFGWDSTLRNYSIQKAVSSQYQATALSIASFAASAMFLLGVVLAGVGLDELGVVAVNVILAAVAATLMALALVSAKKWKIGSVS